MNREKYSVPGLQIGTKLQFRVQSGQLLLSKIDARNGAFGVVPEQCHNAIITGNFWAFDFVSERVDSQFMRWMTRTKLFRDFCISASEGTTNRRYLQEDLFLALEIPLPPLPEQRRIVARIEELAGRIAEAKGLQTQILEHESSLWESILVETFRSLSLSQPCITFGEVCDVVRGGSPRPAGDPTFYGGTIPFLKVGDLTADETMYVTRHTATVTDLGLQHTRRVEAGTLMLTNSGATLGVPKICRFQTTFNDGIQAILNIPADLSKEYLYYFLRSKTSWFRADPARGQGQPNLNTQMVKDLAFPRPPAAVQAETVRLLNDLHERVVSLTAELNAREVRIAALLPSILDKAFRGEV